MHKSIELDWFVIIVGLKFGLCASKLEDGVLIVDLYEAKGTWNIGVKHEDHVDCIRIDLFWLGVPEHAWVVGFALLEGQGDEAANKENFY